MKNLVLFTLCVLFIPLNSIAHPKAVVLLRHAEEPAKGNELSAEGWARARILPQMFKTHPILKGLGAPDFLFAAGAKNEDSSIRSIQTLDSLSKALKIPIRTKFNRDDVMALAEDIDTNPDYEGKVVVITWQHTLIPVIADYLRIKKKELPKGGFPDRFDRIWLITYEPREDKKDKAILNHYSQNLMPQYHEALKKSLAEVIKENPDLPHSHGK